MISTEEKLRITERIIESKTFRNAPTSSAILRFLVQANIEDRFLKEGIIDMEFFGGKPQDTKNNPRVRVNIYNLRKKLNTYYENEGAKEEWQAIIDKGQYSLKFEKKIKEDPKTKLEKKSFRFNHWSLLLWAVSSLVLVWYHFPAQPPKIWKAFFDNGHSTSLYIGDAFGFTGQTISGQAAWIRDFKINSLEDYYQLIKENPQLEASTNPANYTYATRMAENATHDLSRWFANWQNDFEIKYASKSRFSDIKKDNTLYVGRLKDQRNFIYLFNEGNPHFSVKQKMIDFVNHPQLPDTTFQLIQYNPETDYALVSRMPGPNKTAQFFFFSDHDIGVMATVEFFTNPDSLESFQRKYLQGQEYFTAIFRAKGRERINLDLETLMVVGF
ncbi:helix-turn-helix domain-containing protein [Persicobacter diffluens]